MRGDICFGSYFLRSNILMEPKTMLVLAVQKVLSGSGRAGRPRMGKYIGHRLVARPELDNTFGLIERNELVEM